MNLGFTGTRHGARVDQMLALVRVIDRLRPAGGGYRIMCKGHG
jgi:hypothetical protein